MRRVALAAAVVALIGAAPAAAVPPKPYELAAMGTALRTWHNICGGEIVVKHEVLGLDFAGRAHVGPFWRASEYCFVRINSQYRYSPSAYCSLLLHEVGHLAGRWHSDNPNSVMSTPLHADYRCRYLGKFWVKRS